MKLILFFFILSPFACFAQIDTLFVPLNSCTSKKSIIVTKDTNIFIEYFIDSNNVRKYRFINRDSIVLGIGDIAGLQRTGWLTRKGNWIEFYPNGKKRTTGYYYDNYRIGDWTRYYANGNVEEEFSYTFIVDQNEKFNSKAGPYKKYFENGQIAIEGFYEVVFDSAEIQIVNPVTGEEKPGKIRSTKSIKSGIWTYFLPSGVTNRKVEIVHGEEVGLKK